MFQPGRLIAPITRRSARQRDRRIVEMIVLAARQTVASSLDSAEALAYFPKVLAETHSAQAVRSSDYKSDDVDRPDMRRYFGR
jgi:hypothetical protein